MTIPESIQARLEALDAEGMSCTTGSVCTNRAAVDIKARMHTGKEVTLRLCAFHGRRTVDRGLTNATVTSVQALTS